VAQLEQHGRPVRSEAQSFPVLLDRFRHAPLARQDKRDAVVRIRIVASDPNRFAILTERGVELSLHLQQDGEIVMGNRVIRIQLQRVLVETRCLVELAFRLKHDGQTAIGVGVPGIEGRGFLEVISSLVPFSLLEEDQSQVVDRGSRLGFEAYRFREVPRRALEIAGLDVQKGCVIVQGRVVRIGPQHGLVALEVLPPDR
jgi:hypothetical protein